MIKGFNLSNARARYLIVAILLTTYIVLGLNNQLSYLDSHPMPASFFEDFRIYWNAYLRISQGIDPYSGNSVPGLEFRYPIPALLFIGYLSALPTENLRAAGYLTLNLVLLALVLYGVGYKYEYRLKQIWWWFPLAFSFAPFLEMMHVGQINVITMFGSCVMFLYADLWPMGSGLGLMIGAVTKVTPFAFWGYLVVTRRIRAALWGIVMLAIAFIASGVLWGWDTIAASFLMLDSNTKVIFEGTQSQSLVSLLQSMGWMQYAAWPQFQTALNIYIGVVLLASGVLILRTEHTEPFFLVISLGIIIIPNIMWYHHYVFILLPLFVWMAWSQFHPGIVLWALTGLTITQLDRLYLTQGLLVHIFVHLSILGILGWQFSRALKTRKTEGRLALAGFGILLALIVLVPVRNALNANDNLVTARSWIESNLPVGTRVAIEEFSPFIDTRRFTTEQVGSIRAHPLSWYSQNGFEYIVTNSGTYGQFYDFLGQPSVEGYDTFFSTLTPVARFANDKYDIRVLKTNVIAPSHRMAARLGWQGFWLYFLGYDFESSQQLVLYWRTLQSRREPLRLTVRMLDRNDQEIARSTELLFKDVASDGRWPEGITRIAPEIHLPATTAPGLYRFELYVETTDLGRIPFLDQDGNQVADKLFTDQIKIQGTPINPSELQNAHLLNARFGDAIALSRYVIQQRADAANAVVQVTAYWQSIAKTPKDYIVFVHLLNVEGTVCAQIDTQPHNGAYPTSIWDVGETIRDDYVLTIPPYLSPGDYRIELGVYEYPSLVRLGVTSTDGKDLGDHILFDDVIKVTR